MKTKFCAYRQNSDCILILMDMFCALHWQKYIMEVGLFWRLYGPPGISLLCECAYWCSSYWTLECLTLAALHFHSWYHNFVMPKMIALKTRSWYLNLNLDILSSKEDRISGITICPKTKDVVRKNLKLSLLDALFALFWKRVWLTK